GWNAERHLVLLEGDNEEFELVTRHFLFFDAHDLADAMRRVDDMLMRADALAAMRGLLDGSGGGGFYRNGFFGHFRSFCRRFAFLIHRRHSTEGCECHPLSSEGRTA